MKTRFLFVAVLCALFTAHCFAQAPAKWNPLWDPDYAPTTKQSLIQTMRRNSTNATALIKLIGKATNIGAGPDAFRVLDEGRKKHPDSPDALAAFCWAYQISLDTHGKNGGPLPNRTEEQEHIYSDTLARAKQLSPRHWLANLVGGYAAYVRLAERFGEALPLLETSVRFAPQDKYVRSFCWVWYGAALGMASMRNYVYKGQKVTDQQALKALETSAKIDGRRASTWLNIAMIYHYDIKDDKSAAKAKSAFYKAFPTTRKVPKLFKSILDTIPKESEK